LAIPHRSSSPLVTFPCRVPPAPYIGRYVPLRHWRASQPDRHPASSSLHRNQSWRKWTAGSARNRARIGSRRCRVWPQPFPAGTKPNAALMTGASATGSMERTVRRNAIVSSHAGHDNKTTTELLYKICVVCENVCHRQIAIARDDDGPLTIDDRQRTTVGEVSAIVRRLPSAVLRQPLIAAWLGWV
jgi:hypothetical protein